MKDFYQILGIAKGASTSEIKKAYRRLAKQYHPDVNKGNKAAEEKFKEISEAYNVLSSPEQRKKYDMFGSAGAGFGGAASGQGFGGFGGSQGPRVDADFGDLGDLFGELFNMGGIRRGPAQRGGRRQSTAVNGQDTAAEIEISFHEAITGSKRQISIRRGDKTENISVKIPAGVDSGSKVRIAGKGQPGFGGGSPGDLYLNIKAAAHKDFWREGADVYTEVCITVYDAILGATIDVPTISGSVKMKIPAGTASGKKFRFKGKGAPVIGKKGHGDQYALIKIVPPKSIKGKLKKSFQQIATEHPYDPVES